MLIEDPELALEVMRRMVESGVEIVSTLPVE
jgi:pentatricopeptide repeat protein